MCRPRSVEEFHRQADPDRENLCLYGTNDGNWVVDLPAEEVPPEVPEPALGINFARDGMQVWSRRAERPHMNASARVRTPAVALEVAFSLPYCTFQHRELQDRKLLLL